MYNQTSPNIEKVKSLLSETLNNAANLQEAIDKEFRFDEKLQRDAEHVFKVVHNFQCIFLDRISNKKGGPK